MQISSSQFHLQKFPSIISTHLLPPKTLKFQPFNRNFPNWSYGRSSIRCRSRKSFGDKEKNDQRIHNKKKSSIESIPELLLGDEIPKFSFSLPAMLILLGKEGIYEMINHFITFLTKHIEFIIRPAADGGADVGIKWYIEWKYKDLHLGRGCTLDSSHVYNGRIYLRNGKNLLDPLLKWKPTKLIGKESFVMIFINKLDKMGKQYFPRDKTMLHGLSYFVSCLLFIAVIVVLKNTFI
ncbi:hypothetical protein KFK09_007003 [Dendrobium nobile]|uniref:Uncharacterized protein n=1 Tax=Dendrobium nobile TaxID=94219 RepID=A0A8T3BVL9_DENNO|nr:hypothetical protein KFK09_007003 [Dendrobium nobile]